ncbi:hypothetical protein MKW92_020755, partial [Papaver armeniacum]
MEVLRGEVVVIRSAGLDGILLQSIRSDVYTIRILQCIKSCIDELDYFGRFLVLSHAAHESLITQVVCAGKEVISSFQGEGERMLRIEAIKKLWMAAHSSLSMPEGNTDLFKRYFELLAILCNRLWRMQGRGSEDLVLPLIIDAFISRLCAILRIQGPEGLEYFATQRIQSRFTHQCREIMNTDQTKPSDGVTRKRKSEGDETDKCPVCLDVINDD